MLLGKFHFLPFPSVIRQALFDGWVPGLARFHSHNSHICPPVDGGGAQASKESKRAGRDLK